MYFKINKTIKFRLFDIGIYCISLISLILLIKPAVAQEDDFLLDLSLEDLLNIHVETATKTSEKNSLSPAVISVITEQDIRNYGYKTVAQALSHIAGFIDNYDLAIHNFGVRGINSGARSGSRTIKFMLDGQSISFRPTSQNFIDAELIPVSLINRIEVVRGPVSALYGANAFLAVVNIVTKKGKALGENNGQVTVGISSIENAGKGYSISGIYGNSEKKWDYSLGFNISSQDRSSIQLPKISPAFDETDNVASDVDDSNPLSFYAQSTYNINDKYSLNFSGHYQQLNADNPFSDINPLSNNGTTLISLDNMYVKSEFDAAFTDKININSYIVYSRGGTLKEDKIELGADNFFLRRRLGYDGFDFGTEVFFSINDKDSLLIGFDFKRDHHKIETFTREERSTHQQTELNPQLNKVLTNKGLYLQYLWQLSNDWRAVVGFRADDDSVIGQQNSKRLGLVGQLPYNIILKLLYGSSFQSPSPELLYRTAVQAGDIIGNPDLSAQQAETIEISVALPLNEHSHLTVTYFNTQLDDLVVFDSDGSNLFANNSSGSETDGLEIEFRLLWQGINSYLNYSWQQTNRELTPSSLFVLEYRKNGELYPKNVVNWGVNYHWLSQKINMSWNNRWVDARPASSSNVLFINQFYELEPYLDSTFTLSTDRFSFFKGKKSTLQFQITDLFGTSYVTPGFGGIEFPSLGRQFLLSVEQRF